MSCKDVTRRKFFEDVAKYCGAGVAALGVLLVRSVPLGGCRPG